MKRLLFVLAAAAPALMLGACATDYYGGGAGYYAGGPYAYDAYYDDYYGPIYDGYWGTDGGFYYRSGAGDRSFHRGDTTHFRRDGQAGVQGGTQYHPMHGTFTPSPGMRPPHFDGGGHGGKRHGG